MQIKLLVGELYIMKWWSDALCALMEIIKDTQVPLCHWEKVNQIVFEEKKLNTRILTERELVGLYDRFGLIVQQKDFIEPQGY